LKDEMLLRIGVEDGNELSGRGAIAAAAKGCKAMFEEWLRLWKGGAPGSTGPVAAPAPGTAAAARRTIKLKKEPTALPPTSVK
jgi:hypothetical protein